MTLKRIILVAFLLFGLFSCQNNYVPKPRGYYRIDFPQKEYRLFDTTFPFTFEYPVYGKIVRDSSKMAEPYWINIVYSPFNAQLHISYKVINKNLETYLNDAHTLVDKHIPKANAISQREYVDTTEKVFGLVYEITGSDAASTYQFYLTDSTKNFVRGALYFDLVPNNDSLSPVIDFLKKDVEYMIATFRWKKIESKNRPLNVKK
jgi:gliding motility-associated lipoprotein GldD